MSNLHSVEKWVGYALANSAGTFAENGVTVDHVTEHLDGFALHTSVGVYMVTVKKDETQ